MFSWLSLVWFLNVPVSPLKPDPVQLRGAPPPVQFQPSLDRLEQQRVITPDEHLRMRLGAAVQPINVSQWQKACREGAISRQECGTAIALRTRPRTAASGGPLLGLSVVSSDFGMRVHPVHGRWLMHNGRDYAAPTGTPVVAALAGTVVRSGWIGGYGLTVELQHSRPRRRTLYAHLSELAVKPGQMVRQGQQIGRVGSTGISTGPHLHFELRRPAASGWQAVDPAELLGRS
ncbi:MAG: Murein DD-endopeptidase MepM [Synechococcus sp. CC9902]|nr:MAG: Murein DD-endopeptidase MepM [Synechococcus sp. CC9902]